MSKGNQSCTDNNKETENKIKENNTENNLEITENNINLGGQVSFDCDIKNVSPKSNTNEDDNIYDDNGNITKKKKQNFRIKAKREPIPMKLRALPQSFWQQPNNTASQAPGTVYPALPLIYKVDCLPPECRTHEETKNDKEMVTDANTDLLFSLFRVVEDEQRRNQKATTVRRGRPKKTVGRGVKSRSGALKDDDPCLVNTASETLLPLLPERAKNRDSLQVRIHSQQALSLISTNVERPVELKPNNSDHNYSHLLSEVVVRL